MSSREPTAVAEESDEGHAHSADTRVLYLRRGSARIFAPPEADESAKRLQGVIPTMFDAGRLCLIP